MYTLGKVFKLLHSRSDEIERARAGLWVLERMNASAFWLHWIIDVLIGTTGLLMGGLGLRVALAIWCVSLGLRLFIRSRRSVHYKLSVTSFEADMLVLKIRAVRVAAVLGGVILTQALVISYLLPQTLLEPAVAVGLACFMTALLRRVWMFRRARLTATWAQEQPWWSTMVARQDQAASEMYERTYGGPKPFEDSFLV